MRLNKFLSLTLGLSRRASDDAIAAKKVKLNGEIAHLGNRVENNKDEVRYCGRLLKLEETEPTYLLLNKPVGYLSSKVSQGGSPTVYKLLSKQHLKLNLNINDGEYLNKMTHPSSGKTKTYLVKLSKVLTDEDLIKLKSGIQIGDSRPSKFKEIKILKNGVIEVELEEGRNRQIRRTFYELGYRVTFLQRTTLGPYKLDNLEEGQTKLTEKL